MSDIANDFLKRRGSKNIKHNLISLRRKFSAIWWRPLNEVYEHRRKIFLYWFLIVWLRNWLNVLKSASILRFQGNILFSFDKDWEYFLENSLHEYRFCFSRSVVVPCYRKEYNLMAATDLMLFWECSSWIPLDRFLGFQIYVSFL